MTVLVKNSEGFEIEQDWSTFDFVKYVVQDSLSVGSTVGSNDVPRPPRYLSKDRVAVLALSTFAVGLTLGDKFGDSIPLLGGGRR